MARFLTVNLISLIVAGLFGFPFLFRVTFGNSSPSKNVSVAHRPFNDREPRSYVASRSRYGVCDFRRGVYQPRGCLSA